MSFISFTHERDGSKTTVYVNVDQIAFARFSETEKTLELRYTNDSKQTNDILKGDEAMKALKVIQEYA
jgi:hypothetical protein